MTLHDPAKDDELQRLRARVAELEARVAELEAGAPTDLARVELGRFAELVDPACPNHGEWLRPGFTEELVELRRSATEGSPKHRRAIKRLEAQRLELQGRLRAQRLELEACRAELMRASIGGPLPLELREARRAVEAELVELQVKLGEAQGDLEWSKAIGLAELVRLDPRVLQGPELAGRVVAARALLWQASTRAVGETPKHRGRVQARAKLAREFLTTLAASVGAEQGGLRRPEHWRRASVRAHHAGAKRRVAILATFLRSGEGAVADPEQRGLWHVAELALRFAADPATLAPEARRREARRALEAQGAPLKRDWIALEVLLRKPRALAEAAAAALEAQGVLRETVADKARRRATRSRSKKR
jgi:hypothetical protein